MAITDTAPGLEVTILVDGKPLKEYRNADDPDEEGTITRWIEAADGKNFVVHIKAGKNFKYKAEVLGCTIYTDGNRVSSPLIRPSESSATREGCHLPGDRLAKFRFSDLETGMSYVIRALPP